MTTDSAITGRVALAARDALEKSGVSQRSAADKTGIPLVTLSRKLRGLSPFTVAELDAVAQAAGTTITAISQQAEGAA